MNKNNWLVVGLIALVFASTPCTAQGNAADTNRAELSAKKVAIAGNNFAGTISNVVYPVGTQFTISAVYPGSSWVLSDFGGKVATATTCSGSLAGVTDPGLSVITYGARTGYYEACFYLAGDSFQYYVYGFKFDLVNSTPTTNTTTTAVTSAQLFAWAAATYPSYFAGTPTSGQYLQYDYRFYPGSGNFLAVDNTGAVYVVGPISGNSLLKVGTLADFASVITASKTTPTCTSPQVLTNGVCVTPTPACTPPQVLVNGVCSSTASTSGSVSTLAGGGYSGFVNGVGTTARFAVPTGVAVTNTGIVYVTDTANNAVRKIDSSGLVSTLVTGHSGFGLAVDTAGNIYTATNPIYKITPTGTASVFSGSGFGGFNDGSASTASFNYVLGIAVDGSGNVYVADMNYAIRKISPTGTVTTLAGGGTGVTGVPGFVNATGRSARFGFGYGISGIAVDGSGNLYVADSANYAIRKVTPTGVVTTYAGGNGKGYVDGPATTAKFGLDLNVACDSAGNVFVADADNNVIRKISTTGNVSTVAGQSSAGLIDGSASSAKFNFPAALTVDNSGKIYVVDQNNVAIRVIAP